MSGAAIEDIEREIHNLKAYRAAYKSLRKAVEHHTVYSEVSVKHITCDQLRESENNIRQYLRETMK